MEKIRTLTIDGYEVNVSNLRGIVDPGKFEGEWPHAVRDYDGDFALQGFGDVDAFGAYYSVCAKSGTTELGRYNDTFRYYRSDDQGFVTEISLREYQGAEEAYSAFCERNEAIESIASELAEAEAAEVGPCDSCEVVMINRVRCHEHGCPRYARFKSLWERLEQLEEEN